MCSCAHGITPADPNLQEAAAAWEWTHHRVWRLCTLEEVQNRYMCDLSSMVGTSSYFLVLWGQQMQCFTPGEDSSLFWQDAVLVLNSAPMWVSTWCLFSTWLVEVINYFPVQEPVVLLSQNAKKSKQHHGEEAKLGVVHHATECPQQAQYRCLVPEIWSSSAQSLPWGWIKTSIFNAN